MKYDDASLRRPCPICDAGPGQRCRAGNQKAYPKPRKEMHSERRAEMQTTAAALKAMRAARRDEFFNPSFGSKHGTVARYNIGCRCDDCRSAKSVAGAEARRRLRGTLAADDPRHGTTTAYKNYRCRCEPCVEAERVYVAELGQRTKAVVAQASKAMSGGAA